jgi:hypothetical protein
MVDRNYTIFKIKRGIEKTVLHGETQVSNTNTITLNELKATVNPLNVVLWKKSDGSEMTNTHATNNNVVTITDTGTDVDCFFMAYGYRVN